MPTYEYVCDTCHHEWETEQSIKDAALDTCPACTEKSARRLISRTGFVLKGDGWSPVGYSKMPPAGPAGGTGN